MKSVLISAGIMLISAVLSVTGFAQVTASAGPDKIVCSDWNGLVPVQIGGAPTATGGTSPYTYTWETHYTFTIGSHVFHNFASDYLNDTTLANPEILYGNEDTLVFRVTVKDAASNIAADSMVARFSVFMATLEDKRKDIYPGDSVQLYSSVIGGIPPVSCAWVPDYCLSDPHAAMPWAKPDHDVAYVNTLTDAGGCQATDMDAFEVHVILEGINGKDRSAGLISIDPNPLTGRSEVRLACPPENTELRFFGTGGQLRKTIVPASDRFTISNNEFEPGLYIYNLVRNGVRVATGKLLVR